MCVSKGQAKTVVGRLHQSVLYFCLAIQLSGTEYVEVGSPIRLLCNASGKSDPPSNIEWFFERQPLYSDVTSGLFVTTKVESKILFSMVLIQRSNPRHQGVYVCRAANGDSTSMAVYVLNGKPWVRDLFRLDLKDKSFNI